LIDEAQAQSVHTPQVADNPKSVVGASRWQNGDHAGTYPLTARSPVRLLKEKPMDGYINEREAAHMHGVTVDQIRQLDADGHLPNARHSRAGLDIYVGDLTSLS
jgi:hypothetical protein